MNAPADFNPFIILVPALLLSFGSIAYGVWSGKIPVTRPPEPPTPKLPESGPIGCPYCKAVVAEEAAYLAQQVQCPNCHAIFTAPHFKGAAHDPAVQEAGYKLLMGLLSAGFGIAVWWWLSTF